MKNPASRQASTGFKRHSSTPEPEFNPIFPTAQSLSGQKARRLRQRAEVQRNDQLYELLKTQWSKDNPGATSEQYEAAIRIISKKCGV